MTRALSLLMIEDSETDAELMLAELSQYGFDTTFERVDSESALRAALA